MGDAKQRRGAARKAKARDAQAAPPVRQAQVPAPAGLRKVARDLTALTLLIAVPYAVYSAYLWVHLESGWLRPPVGHGESRQLLIVGSQSSGTVQTSASLATLGFEVAHEASDASTTFCRDGTVSWFHGIRFLPGIAPDESVELICARSLRNMGFHPAGFRRSTSCSYRRTWDACWARECGEIIRSEWGCAITEGRACDTPFAKTLLQARHPLRTMESLVVKFCRNETAPVSHALALFAAALWPAHAWAADSCLPVVGWYVTLYYEAMMAAVDARKIDGVYKAEAVGVCDVARMGGFGSAAYPPARQLYAEVCASPGGGQGLADGARNARNHGRVRIDMENLTAIDRELATRVLALGARMGYDVP
ncbi:hypothetical protein KFE25_010153 [Diacronema lutheri]|uniref:Uncharacterized protein n=1 Tax=Diacronema lutheri TaxID=2081491 RepID=A0A8J5XST6_DIALT|nr:hypothetical protein KFE25_010153 [Diacronema lutheri]